MAQSKDPVARLDRLESALVHLTDVIVLQGERMDFGFTSMREEMRTMREEMRTMRDTLTVRIDTLSDRFDRFVGMATKERTSSVERFALIEERLAKLEERAGF
jgi:hypothetical protein